MPKSNGSEPGKVYTVTEIDADAVPGSNRGQVWQQFYYDIKLRLERTPTTRALRAEFVDPKTAQYARQQLVKRCTKYLGPKAVECKMRTEDGRGVLYIRRGERFGKDELASVKDAAR